MNNKQHTIFVCTTCASVWQDGQQVGTSGGQQLLQQLQELAQDWELQTKFSIQGVECMSACSHACVIAFLKEEKSTYIFGNLPVHFSASAVLKSAIQYYIQPSGLLPCSEAPEPLEKHILASIPPLSKWTKLNVSCC
jgi:predicted metal-binding protein